MKVPRLKYAFVPGVLLALNLARAVAVCYT